MKKSIFVALLAFVILARGSAFASLTTIDAFANSSGGGIGVDTGIDLMAGQTLIVTVDPNDLWSAGALPRWSNADGLTHDLLATGTDESGQAAGTPIGKDYGLWTQSGFSAPYGSLVGELGGTFFLLGTDFSGPAPASGTLKLFYWDSYTGDNTGSVAADVRAVPEPGSFILLGVGLIGVSIFVRRSTGLLGRFTRLHDGV